MRNRPICLPLACLALIVATTSCGTQSSASGENRTMLALSQPSDQWMAQGESRKVAIQIDRTGFADAVQIAFANLPSGVRVESETIPAGSSSKDFVLVASPTAPTVDKHIVTVTARGSGISTSQTFEISVKTKA